MRGGGDYLQTIGARAIKKKGGGELEERERGKGRCNSPENMSYLRGREGGAGGAEAGEKGVLLTTAKLSPTTQLPRHFSSGSERASGWRGQPLSDVDSVERGRTQTRSRLHPTSLQHATLTGEKNITINGLHYIYYPVLAFQWIPLK